MEKIFLYSDFNQTKKWNENTFEVEFKGKKARVKNNGWFGAKYSRFNKLIQLGHTTSGYHYVLTVNGQKVFFIAKYNIYS